MKARAKQLQPPGRWVIWGIRSGRGFGKTLLAANWIGQLAAATPRGYFSVIAPTYGDVRFTCFEGETGLINVIPPDLISDISSSLPSITLTNGALIRGFAADSPERLRGPQAHAAWCDEIACLVSGTLVRTNRGEIPIENISHTDLVWTRQGLKKVLAGGLSARDAELWRITTEDGKVLIGTSNHPVWSVSHGEYIELHRLQPGVIILSWEKFRESWSGTERDGSCTKDDTRIGRENSSQDKSIFEGKGLSLQGLLSIIGTTTRSTIGYAISKLSLTLGITNFIQRDSSIGLSKNFLELDPPNGKRRNQLLGFVKSANESLAQPGLGRSSVTPHVDNGISTGDIPGIKISTVEKLSIRADVYNLDVEDAHEFFANGILTHNSWKYPELAWDNLMFGLRLGDNPQVCWTSTPKPKPFVRALSEDPRCVLITGSTYENYQNLPETYFQNVAKYEGTNVGRQELWGELLDPEEAGFVKRSQWRLWKAHRPLPKFKHIVMSLDTAFTEDTFNKKKQENDPTACSVWGLFDYDKKLNVMLLDCWEDRLGFPGLMKRVKKERVLTYGDANEPRLRAEVRSDRVAGHTGRKIDLILIEDKGSGISLRQALAMENVFTEPYNPHGEDKLTRLHYVSPLFAHGRVWAIESDSRLGKPKSWADPLISQVCSFVGEGSIEHDDLLDTTTQALRLYLDKFFGALEFKRDVEDILKQRAIAKMKQTGNPYGV